MSLLTVGSVAFDAIETPFGKSSSGLKKVKLANEEILFLPRHGKNHENLPSEVNYRANIYALKKFGAKSILSFSAVGSLQKEYAPGDLVIPTQYIDKTKGIRNHTFCGDGIVGHVSLAHPVCKVASKKLIELIDFEKNWKVFANKTYLCIEGPYFSTQAESHLYREMKADIIGMTNFPEFALAREASLNYLPCCFITDFDCWNEEHPHVTLEDVLEVMRNNNAKAFSVAKQILKFYPDPMSLWIDGDDARKQGLNSGLMTSKDSISKKQREWLKIVLS